MTTTTVQSGDAGPITNRTTATKAWVAAGLSAVLAFLSSVATALGGCRDGVRVDHCGAVGHRGHRGDRGVRQRSGTDLRGSQQAEVAARAVPGKGQGAAGPG